MGFPARRETVVFRDASIIFRNFSGEEGRYNVKGQKNFSILLDEVTARDLEKNGWNVKPLPRREEDDEQMYHLKVKVNYSNRPPRCYLISSGGSRKTLLGEDMLPMFDQNDYAKIDLTITPHDWDISGKTGRTAYLKSLFFHIYEDELEQEYSEVPEFDAIGGSPRELEPGARQAYDYEGEVVEEL